MSSFNKNLMFYPLYFIYHDQWGFKTWSHNRWGDYPIYYRHRGHVHFFMLGYDRASCSQQAYKGQQVYKFQLDDEWSTRIKEQDPNIPSNLEIKGTPKWYFWIKEYWRRIYIQYWDDRNNSDSPFLTGKKGVKYDASLPIHTFGPYRESKDNFFYNTNLARTLPVEYWTDEAKTVRNHWLKKEKGDLPAYTWDWNEFDSNTDWVIPRTIFAGHQDNKGIREQEGPSEDNPARRFGYSDDNYIYPTIEYQYMQHLDWERLPYSNERDVDSENFGDGFEIEISIPFKDGKTGVIQSPFSNDNGTVYPPCNYFHNFEEKGSNKIPKYSTVDPVTPSGVLDAITTDDTNGHNVVWDNTEWNIPDGKYGENMNFHIPEHLDSLADGIWVEQCLGAIIKAKALVTVEDNFGKRYDIWVTGSQFMVQDNFAGSDQNAPE